MGDVRFAYASMLNPPQKARREPRQGVKKTESMRRSLSGAAGFLLILLAAGLWGGLATDARADYRTDYQRALRLGKLGYEYGYPLLRFYEIRLEGLSVASENELEHSRNLSGPESQDFRAPNADTLYSTAHLDLRDEPVVLTVPAVDDDRYYSFQFVDPYTSTAGYVGTRTTGRDAGHFAIVPPGWTGVLPSGVERLEVPYDHLYGFARTGTNEDGTLDDEHKIQDEYRLTSVSEFSQSGPAGPAPQPSGTPQDFALPGGLRFFDALGSGLRTAPPPAADDPLLDRLATVGVGPGAKPSTDRNLSSGTKAGLRAAVGWRRTCGGSSDVRNGWNFPPPHIGDFGTDYCLRANLARGGLGVNTREESVYAGTSRDSFGIRLTGDRNYVIHLASPPPADAFWSFTVYGPDGFLAPNPINRYALGDRSGLRTNEDGSIDLYLSTDGDVPYRSNWLPTPAGPFSLLLRLYVPQTAALDGTWSPPPVRRR
jgi:hypothetical protein